VATSPTHRRPRPGRRPGNPDTRTAILDAARGEFVEKGYDKTSMRGVAKVAGVDPALVHHYFDSKDGLLVESLALPFDPRQVIPELTSDGVEDLGMRIVQRFLWIWDDPERRAPLVALVKASMTTDAAADLIRTGLVRMILGPITTTIDAPDAAVRAQCVASALLGLAMARYIVALEPFASTPAPELAALIAPTLQAYIEGD
jgi:AcrR family transcriptional regulator